MSWQSECIIRDNSSFVDIKLQRQLREVRCFHNMSATVMIGSEYLPLHHKSKGFTLKVPFGKLAWITVSLPLLSFIFCVIWSILFHFERATYTHCEVSVLFCLVLLCYIYIIEVKSSDILFSVIRFQISYHQYLQQLGGFLHRDRYGGQQQQFMQDQGYLLPKCTTHTIKGYFTTGYISWQ